MTAVVARILRLPIWIGLLVVFGLPALEASVFLGVVVPGETALILGGVLAAAHRLPLWAVLVLGIGGAVLGDSIGYVVGRVWGERLLASVAGRVVRPAHVDRGKEWLSARGGRAVLLGRFTAALRALMPGLAGMARVPYRRFLVFNVLGAVGWGGGIVLLGYAAGASWQRAAHLASGVGFGLLAAVAVAVLVGVLIRRRRLRRAAG